MSLWHVEAFRFTNGADSAWFCFALQPLNVAKGTLKPEIAGSQTYDTSRDEPELGLTLTRD